MGTASILEVLVKDRPRLRRMLVASSMSIYGEGRYQCAGCGPVDPLPRPAAQLAAGDWSMHCPVCGSAVTAIPTPESKPLCPRSVYATNKRDQEELVLTVARSMGLSAIALRFFNAYGPRQALSNPYTGVAAIFSSALLSGRRPLVFEDGRQVRDFIHVSDVVEACALALQKDEVADQALNVGTGRPTSLLQLLDLLRAEVPGAAEIEPEILGRFREGDIRACFADVSRARALLGFEPRISISDGARELAKWARDQATRDRSEEAFDQLRRFGLVR
jgi:dTDP-L-rhamnose 4-epimerase